MEAEGIKKLSRNVLKPVGKILGGMFFRTVVVRRDMLQIGNSSRSEKPCSHLAGLQAGGLWVKSRGDRFGELTNGKRLHLHCK